MNWYFIKVEYKISPSERTEMCSLIINCHPSELYNKVRECIRDGYDRRITDIVKL